MHSFNCPTCKKALQWDSSNPDRPFCSERCRLIDLGAWANEEYQISKPSGNEMMAKLAMDPELAEELLLELEQAGEKPLH